MSTTRSETDRARAVITGLGVVSSIGIGVPAFRASLIRGESGIRPITQFDASRLSSQIAGEVAGFSFVGKSSRKRARQLDRGSRFGFVAAQEALKDSGLRIEGAQGRRVAMIAGSALGGGVAKALRFHDRIRERGPERATPLFMLFTVDACAGYLAVDLGIRGPNFTVSSGCSSAANAMTIALELLRSNRIDSAVVCGIEAPLHETVMAPFCASGILSQRNSDPTEACRPFDVDRDGMVVAEGAGVLIIERERIALDRGARIYAELADYGTTCDPYAMGQVAPDPAEMVDCMRQALQHSGIEPHEVDYINAYANASRHTDALEAQALLTVFADYKDDIFVSSTKSLVGHALGASAAIETIATVLAIEGGFVPPSLNCANLDPRCGGLRIAHTAESAPISIAMKNSFSMGNRNTTIMIRNYNRQ